MQNRLKFPEVIYKTATIEWISMQAMLNSPWSTTTDPQEHWCYGVESSCFTPAKLSDSDSLAVKELTSEEGRSTSAGEAEAESVQ